MATPFDYIESRADADELIQEFGQTVQVRRTTNSGTSYEPTRTPADFNTFGVEVEFTAEYRRGGSVQEKDQRWIVAAGPLATQGVAMIEPGDAPVVDGITPELVRVKPLKPAGVVVLYDCHVRF